MTNAKGESTNALFGFIRSTLKVIKDFDAKHIVAVFDGPNNTKKRKELYPEYKAHRQVMPADLSYQIQRAQVLCSLMGIPWISEPEVEADDTMGSIAMWAAREYGAHAYLCSSDKDLCQLVEDKISILNTSKDNLIIDAAGVFQIHGIPPSLMVDYLAIIGDSSDNVPGLPGFGPKTAAKYLNQFGSLDAILSNPANISEQKKREIFIEKKDLALLSRELVKIDLSIPIPKDTDFFARKALQVSELREFLKEMNFKTLLKDLESSEESQESRKAEVDVEYTLVDNEESLKKLMDYLQTQKSICFDTETTDVQPLRAELVGIGFSVEPAKAWYVPANGTLGLEKLLAAIRPLMENEAIAFYGHNVKYDMHVLRNYGINVANIGFDTILAYYLLNSHSRQSNLDVLSLEFFNKVKIPIGDLIGKGKSAISMRDVAIDKVCAYCCEDVDYTCRLKLLLEKQIEERGLGNLLYNLELPLTSVLMEMERTGIFLDVPYLNALGAELKDVLSVLKKEIIDLAGEEFNLNSPKQLGEMFQKLEIKPLKKTSTGQIKTDSDVLEGLKDRYPIARLILDYRVLEKLRSTYVESLPGDVNPNTGRIHCTFNQFVAATGRLSCQNPNLQNIPVRTDVGRGIRAAFRPQKEGWSYLAADYSQIELRLLAHFSEDPHLLNAFNLSEDVHSYTASILFGCRLEDVQPTMRYQAKTVNFGIIYGQQAYGLSQELGIDMKSAALFIEMYFNRYDKVKGFIEAYKEKARVTGKTLTLTGRERAIPEILSKNSNFRSLAERLAVNTPLQGTAADMIKMAMLSIAKKMKESNFKAKMILQVHDELIFEAPDDELEALSLLVKDEMEGVMKLKVPLVVDIAIGKNWKDC